MNAMLRWDYSALAEHYRYRAPYADAALRELFAMIAMPRDARAIDIGAGTGRFTSILIARGFSVTAVEPNASMRAIGAATASEARWIDTRGEATGLEDASSDLVAFASSFNVMSAQAALAEAARLLPREGWLVCLWNHRDLDDPLQAAVQAAIVDEVPDYSHGTRREDPSAAIAASGRFDATRRIVGSMRHDIRSRDFVDAFRAHATLIRQAGARMPRVLDAIAQRLEHRERIAVPFITRVFAAQRLPK